MKKALLLRFLITVVSCTAVCAQSAATGFDSTVKPFLTRTCYACHNDRNPSGGLNIMPYTAAGSMAAQRDRWELIVHKIRKGEMPPMPAPRPDPSRVQAVLGVLDRELEKIDEARPPDPGRVTARRLNRAEYANTIRDLLGVEFRADQDFPTDDSGHGFDNIGDVLTISPVLMEKYLLAAERIAARAVGADPLPKPLEAEYHSRDRKIRRVNPSTIEARHRIEFDGDYILRFGMPGHRGETGKPVTFGVWIDGQLVHTRQVETKPSKLVYFEPYSEEEVRLPLTEGEHLIRAGFVNDDFVHTLSEKQLYNNQANKYLNMVKFIGPFAPAEPPEFRRRLLVCDPESGRACWQQILTPLARRAYRRPVRPDEVAALVRFAEKAKAEGMTGGQSLQIAIQAMLVSPHFLFRIERDPAPGKSQTITSIELASRLSYFLWSSMPDEELLSLAEQGKLIQPAVLRGQVRRMLADSRSSALATNFAGQWLETRNLDIVKPDPQKFPAWDADLRDAMKAETRLFFEHVLKENRPVSDFLDARYTFLSETLARHYGIDGVRGPEFRRVDLTTPQRGGLLTHASVLTVSSYPTRTSPVIRGKYILENFLGAPPPPPPPDVPSLEEEGAAANATLRQRMEKHRSNPVCASCHQRMDTIGFGMENYDAIGRWREKDGDAPLDVAGTLPDGHKFSTPAELRGLLLADLPDFARTITEKMLIYALGRGLEGYDRVVVKQITRRAAAEDYKFQSFVYAIVESLPFQSRRGEHLTQHRPNTPKETASR